MKGYKTSKDYKRLKELLDNGYTVVCFTTRDFFSHVCLARLLYKGTKNEEYSFFCRGTSFINYWTHGIKYSYTLEELCAAQNIEFIEPDEI